MTDDKTRKDDLPQPSERAEPKPRFLDGREIRFVPLGKLRTEDEARLAAEIEKLR